MVVNARRGDPHGPRHPASSLRAKCRSLAAASASFALLFFLPPVVAALFFPPLFFLSSDVYGSAVAYKRGAEGEDRVGKVLSKLPDAQVLNDVLIAGCRVDHLVSLPALLVLVETKSWRARIAPSGDPRFWLVNGVLQESPLVLAYKKAQKLSRALGVEVVPLVVLAKNNGPGLEGTVNLRDLRRCLEEAAHPGRPVYDLRKLVLSGREARS